MGGPQVNPLQLLAAGQLDVAMGDDLQMLSARRAGRCRSPTIGATFQKNPTVIIAHPGVASLADLKGKPIAIGAASNTTFWPWLKQRYGFTDDQKRPYAFSRAAVPRRSQPLAAGLRHVGAVLDREGGVTPVVFLLADLGYPPYSRGARRARATTLAKRARRAAALRAARRPRAGRATSPIRRRRNALIRKDNPEMTRRAARLRPSQDASSTRSSPAATRATQRPPHDDRRALAGDARLPARRRARKAGRRLSPARGRSTSCAT